ncbi:MAG: 8-oxo-dGTP diphosphatase [Motiliproteus sp.]|jgi:8-oxo-dGTP diphosphatase
MRVVHVVAAAIFGPDGRLLISRRPDHLHQGGLLEFPGGKVDPGETVTQALIRELQEELGITPVSFEPLLQIPHTYPDKRVLLDVWRVSRYLDEPEGLEGQALHWLGIDELDPGQFPAANSAIITALSLPQQYLITGTAVDAVQWLVKLQAALDAGIKLVQLRAPALDAPAYRSLALAAHKRCRAAGARLILNRDPRELGGIEADGLHLNRHLLLQISAEQLTPWRRGLLGVSCHNAQELQRAEQLGVDYAVLSPVLPTDSHPDAETLGWAGFKALAGPAALPVYALGGMARGMERTAIEQGAQGIASISALWEPTLWT